MERRSDSCVGMWSLECRAGLVVAFGVPQGMVALLYESEKATKAWGFHRQARGRKQPGAGGMGGG